MKERIILALLLLCSSVFAADLFTVVDHDDSVWNPNASYPCTDVVRINATSYRLYYADFAASTIYMITSTDGMVWVGAGTPVMDWPNETYTLRVKYYEDAFTGADLGTNASAATNMHWRMWYTDEEIDTYDPNYFRYAESVDGIAWRNLIAVSQFGPTIADDYNGEGLWSLFGGIDTIYTPNATNEGTDWTFRIYYNQVWQYDDGKWGIIVSLAFSENGYNWTGYDPEHSVASIPIFEGTYDNVTFDSNTTLGFTVVKNSATSYDAFYTGIVYLVGPTTPLLRRPRHNVRILEECLVEGGIGHVTSCDGISWTRRQTVIESSSGWHNCSLIWKPSIAKITCATYKLWYTVMAIMSDVQLGYADLTRTGCRGCGLSTGAIVGIVLGGVALIIILVTTLVFATSSSSSESSHHHHRRGYKQY